ncbi:MAG: hypothetical protein AAF184_13655 [Pseudomonadota bacterium]
MFSSSIGDLTTPKRVALIALTLLSLGAGAAERLHRYDVQVDGALERLSVHACLAAGTSERRLGTGSSRAGSFLIRDALSNNLSLRGDGQLRFTGSGDGRCFDYAVSLERARGANDSRLLSRYESDLVTRSTLWLWRPVSPREGDDIEVRFSLPSGLNVSVPWQRVGDGSTHTYRVGATSRYWPARTAFGRFDTQTVRVAGARLHLAALAGTRPREMTQWLQEAAGAVTELYGRFPVPDVQVLVIPYGRGNEAVPWAQIVRGGGSAALFFVDPSRPLREFRQDWTATHEFSHLLLPFLNRDDAWLSEGLASYYQEVLRARAGLLDERRAWERIEAGFDRGRAQGKLSSLAYLSSEMGRERAHRHVYWSGAAFWLEMDVLLRRQGQSLDEVLLALGDCCLPATQMWTGQQLLGQLDRLSGSTLFTRTGERYARQRGFPPMQTLFTELGVRVFGSDSVQLDDGAPDARVRQAIMRASTANAAPSAGN